MTDIAKSFLIGEWSIPGAGSNQHNFRVATTSVYPEDIITDYSFKTYHAKLIQLFYTTQTPE